MGCFYVYKESFSKKENSEWSPFNPSEDKNKETLRKIINISNS